MLEGADLLTPDRNGIEPSKPPLAHWLGYVVATIFGIEALVAARIVSLGAGALLLVVTAGLARVLSGGGAKAQETRLVPWAAAASLALSYPFVALSLDARVDMVFALFCSAAISEALRSTLFPDDGDRFSPVRLAAFLALAILAKGPLGVVLPALVTASAVWAVRRGHGGIPLRRLAPPFLFGVLGGASWYLALLAVGEYEILERQLGFENYSRFLGGGDITIRPWYFYFPAFLRGLFPWSVIFAFAGWCDLRRAWRAETIPVARRVALAWFCGGFVLFSLAAGKRDSYLLALYPAVAIYLATFAPDAMRAASVARERVLRGSLWFVTSCLLVGLVPLLLLSSRELFARVLPPALFEELHTPRVVVSVVCALMLMSLIAALVAGERLSLHFRAALVAAGILTVLGGATAFGHAVKGAGKGYLRMAIALSAQIPAGENLTVVRARSDEYTDPILYYFHRPVSIFEPDEGLLPCEPYLLARRSSVLGNGALRTHPGAELDELAILREPYRVWLGLTGRELVLLRCAPGDRSITLRSAHPLPPV